MLSLLESWNYKSVPELQKDPDREAKFLYSKFSPYSDCIRTDTKFRLSEIVQIVQTTILKMYVDMNLTRKIYEFFGNVDQVTNQYQTSLFINPEKL